MEDCVAYRYKLLLSIDDGEPREAGAFRGLVWGPHRTLFDRLGVALSDCWESELGEGELQLIHGDLQPWVSDIEALKNVHVDLELVFPGRANPSSIHNFSYYVYFYPEHQSVVLSGTNLDVSGHVFRFIEQRQQGLIDKKGLWCGLDKKMKKSWLLSNVLCRDWSREDLADQVITLDGKIVLDEYCFYCAIGEAVDGPGGYFGQCLDGVDDCFFGGFGIENPVTLIWRNFECSKRAFEERGVADKLRILFEIFAYRKVDVILK